MQSGSRKSLRIGSLFFASFRATTGFGFTHRQSHRASRYWNFGCLFIKNTSGLGDACSFRRATVDSTRLSPASARETSLRKTQTSPLSTSTIYALRESYLKKSLRKQSQLKTFWPVPAVLLFKVKARRWNTLVSSFRFLIKRRIW